MPIKTACPTCEKAYTLAESMSGKQVRCKHCGDSFFVKEDGEEEPTAVEAFVAEEVDRPRHAPAGRIETTATRRDVPPQVQPARGGRGRRRGPPAAEATQEQVEQGPGHRAHCRRGGPAAGPRHVLLVYLLSGGSKFTVENFKKIKAGMSERRSHRPDRRATKTMDVGLGLMATKTMIWRSREASSP